MISNSKSMFMVYTSKTKTKQKIRQRVIYATRNENSMRNVWSLLFILLNHGQQRQTKLHIFIEEFHRAASRRAMAKGTWKTILRAPTSHLCWFKWEVIIIKITSTFFWFIFCVKQPCCIKHFTRVIISFNLHNSLLRDYF